MVDMELWKEELDKLPHKRKNINWKESAKNKCKFKYCDIKGEIEIVDYFIKNKYPYLKVKYKNKIHLIHVSNFQKCQLGSILGVHIYTKEYKYNIGDIITDIKYGKLEILKQIRMKNGKWSQKGYDYKCLICGNEDKISESNLSKKHGCTICSKSNHKVLIGCNDMWTTNPEQAKLLLDPNDGYKYMQGSDQPVNWKCPDCGEIIKNRKISDILRSGLSCPRCSDKLSYPEKFVFNIFDQLNINFTYQLSKTVFKWCNNYRYDFYFELNDEKYIIETHGLQHYSSTTNFSYCGGRTLEEEQENDRLKKDLALQNGIKEDNYIVIDCSKSELEWIKEHILISKSNNIFDLSKINWLQCHKYACSSLVKKACELWNSGIHSTKEIGEIMKLSRHTILKYLKQGTKIGWCNYNLKEVMIKGRIKNSGNYNERKIICLNNSKIFNSIAKAGRYYNIKSLPNIINCCRDKRKSAGKDPKTGEPLIWMYYEDYLRVYKNVI